MVILLSGQPLRMGEITLIKMGIESSASRLHDQLLLHPERYFFISVIEERPALCLQTCDGCGNGIEIKEIDGLMLRPEGDLVSVFQEDLQEAMIKREPYLRYLEGEQYPISQAIKENIAKLPGFIDWVIESVPIKGRCLMLYPSWEIAHSDWKGFKNICL
jgi:hypothetical protein